MKTLEGPDQYSRTEDFDGRRIEKTSGGWKILNYQKYRQKKYSNERDDENYDSNGYVYFAGNKERIKIGFSHNPWARIRELKTAFPEMEIIATLKNTKEYENELHNKFKHLNISREWFKREKEIDDFINTVVSTVATTVATPYASASVSASSSASGIQEDTQGGDKTDPPTWRTNFEVYQKRCEAGFDVLCEDFNWIAERKEFHPGLNIRLSLEKMFGDFWSTKAGWKNKRDAARGKADYEIDWKATAANGLSMKQNQVWIPKGSFDNEARNIEIMRSRDAKDN